MLTKLLSETDKVHLLELLNLLAVSDKPLLWNGKRKNELPPETVIRQVYIQKGVQESALIAELESECTQSSRILLSEAAIEKRLFERIKTFPMPNAEDPETRVQAATQVLKEILEVKIVEFPSVSKLMLFELMLMALCDGSISSIEWVLLKEFQYHHQLEDFIFDDLLERAETMNREISKTISIILE